MFLCFKFCSPRIIIKLSNYQSQVDIMFLVSIRCETIIKKEINSKKDETKVVLYLHQI